MLTGILFVAGSFLTMAAAVAVTAGTRPSNRYADFSRAQTAARVTTGLAIFAYVVAAGVVCGEPVGMLCMMIAGPGLLMLADALD